MRQLFNAIFWQYGSLKMTGENEVKNVCGCPRRPQDRSRSMHCLQEKVILQPGVI